MLVQTFTFRIHRKYSIWKKLVYVFIKIFQVACVIIFMDKKQDNEGVLELQNDHIATAKLAGFFSFISKM